MATVAFIGAGPGAADLITVRGAQMLAQADVVLADALIDPALRTWAPQARWIDVGKGDGRSVALTTAMTREGQLTAGRHADTEVFYMAGKQLPALARQLLAAGWAPTTPVAVVSRAGWPDAIHSQHTLDTLPQASVLHRGRPTVVITGAGAAASAGSSNRHGAQAQVGFKSLTA